MPQQGTVTANPLAILDNNKVLTETTRKRSLRLSTVAFRKEHGLESRVGKFSFDIYFHVM